MSLSAAGSNPAAQAFIALTFELQVIRAERVTGGNSGIGMAIALELARQGANIVIDYIAYPEATEAIEQQITALGDGRLGLKPT